MLTIQASAFVAKPITFVICTSMFSPISVTNTVNPANSEIKKIKEILEKHEKRIKFLESMVPNLKSEEVKPVESKVGFARLAQKIGVDSEKISQLFDIENDNLTVLKVAGEDEREKTKKG